MLEYFENVQWTQEVTKNKMIIIDDNNICRLIKWEPIQTIKNTKTMKIKRFPRYTKINKKYGKNRFKFYSQHKT